MKKSTYASTFHRDGSITFWSVYTQQWCRTAIETVYADDIIMASLEVEERERIKKRVKQEVNNG